MTIPVLYAAAEANPNDLFTMLTQTSLIPLFVNRPPNVKVTGVNTKMSEKSFFGFFRFALRLRVYKFDTVLDLHDVIRSRIVDFIFRLCGTKIFIVDKRRGERKRLVARPPKNIRPLRPVTACYADVFRKARFCFEETFVSLRLDAATDKDDFGVKNGQWIGTESLLSSVFLSSVFLKIGIAPFAKHQGKVYPIEKMERVIETLSEQEGLALFLFGGRGEEERTLNLWEKKYKNTICIAGRFSMDTELALIGQLDLLVSMDSANMHLASLVGTNVISIWGATHPYAGFYGYRQHEDLAVQVDLPCRPCSIYGNKPCYRGDWACMSEITPQQIIRKVNDYLKTS